MSTRYESQEHQWQPVMPKITDPDLALPMQELGMMNQPPHEPIIEKSQKSFFYEYKFTIIIVVIVLIIVLVILYLYLTKKDTTIETPPEKTDTKENSKPPKGEPDNEELTRILAARRAAKSQPQTAPKFISPAPESVFKFNPAAHISVSAPALAQMTAPAPTPAPTPAPASAPAPVTTSAPTPDIQSQRPPVYPSMLRPTTIPEIVPDSNDDNDLSDLIQELEDEADTDENNEEPEIKT